jgi:hypothetical protein
VGNDLTVNDNLIVNDNFNMTGGVFNAISTGLGSVGEFWELIQIFINFQQEQVFIFFIYK